MNRIRVWWGRRQFKRLPLYMGQRLDVYPAFELKVKLQLVQANLRERYPQ